MAIIIIYLEEMYIKVKYSVFFLSVWYSQSNGMVNVFGDSVASASGNLQVVKKVVATVGLFKDYIDEIRQSYELGFTPYGLHTNVCVFVTTFVFIVGGYLYWTMLPRWRLAIGRLQRMK